MSVQRVPSVPFAQIANEALRDKRLSFKARGLLALVLSHSGEWIATRRWLESQSEQDGRAAIQTALDELTNLGYRSVHHERDGVEIRTVVVWRHAPEVSISCPTENLSDGKPARQETGRAIEHNSSEHHSEEHHQEQVQDGDWQWLGGPRDNAVPLAGCDPTGQAEPSKVAGQALALPIGGNGLYGAEKASFDAFWQAYPRKAAKAAAAKAWLKAVRLASPDVLLAAAKRYRDDPNREDQFTAHPATWLNQERWNDEALPAKQRKMTGGDARMDNYRHLYDKFNDERREIAQ